MSHNRSILEVVTGSRSLVTNLETIKNEKFIKGLERKRASWHGRGPPPRVPAKNIFFKIVFESALRSPLFKGRIYTF